MTTEIFKPYLRSLQNLYNRIGITETDKGIQISMTAIDFHIKHFFSHLEYNHTILEIYGNFHNITFPKLEPLK